MRKSKLIVFQKEFPFLSEIIRLTKFDPIQWDIKVSRLDGDFLFSIPVEQSYSCSAGASMTEDRLYAVEGGAIREITLIPALDHSTGYAYDVATTSDGDTYLAALISAGCTEPEFLVLHHFSTCQYYDGREEDRLTILKPMKGSSITIQWAEALRDAEVELRKEIFKVDNLNQQLTNYLK